MKTILLTICISFATIGLGWDTATIENAQKNERAVIAGGKHTCALSETGKLSCWGYNTDKQSTVPSHLTKVQQVSLGNFHSCALSEGEVHCWGANGSGQSTVPSRLPKIRQISLGNYHTCALSEAGQVFCWGLNNESQTNVPPTLAKIKQISSGGDHNCALSQEGQVTCWGYNGFNQTNPPTSFKAKQISAGGQHTCAVSEEGIVKCWGKDSNYQRTVPSGLSKITHVSSGDDHTCALSEKGDVTCWGYDGKGQCSVPETLVGKVNQIASGRNHTCAISDEGVPVCWGEADLGQLDIPNEVKEPKNGVPLFFDLPSLEKDFKKLATKLYAYKANYVEGLSSLLNQFQIDSSQPISVGYRAYVARYFVLEMVSPLIETTETPYLKKKVVDNLKARMVESRKFLILENIHDVDLFAGIVQISLVSSRLAAQSGAQFLLNETPRKDAEKLIAELGEIEVQAKSKGYNLKTAKTLLNTLESHLKLIEVISNEPRTAGFGATLEKIKQYLKDKL